METDKKENLIPVLLKNEKIEHLVVYKKYESPAGFKPWWKVLCETLSNKWIVFSMIIIFTSSSLILNLTIHGMKPTDPFLIKSINHFMIWIYNRLLVHIITEAALIIGIVGSVVLNYHVWLVRLEEVSGRRKFFDGKFQTDGNVGNENFGTNLNSWGCFLNLVAMIYGIELYGSNLTPEIENHKYKESGCVQFCGYLCCVSEITSKGKSSRESSSFGEPVENRNFQNGNYRTENIRTENIRAGNTRAGNIRSENIQTGNYSKNGRVSEIKDDVVLQNNRVHLILKEESGYHR